MIAASLQRQRPIVLWPRARDDEHLANLSPSRISCFCRRSRVQIEEGGEGPFVYRFAMPPRRPGPHLLITIISYTARAIDAAVAVVVGTTVVVGFSVRGN